MQFVVESEQVEQVELHGTQLELEIIYPDEQDKHPVAVGSLQVAHPGKQG